jgi:hypothetical protein
LELARAVIEEGTQRFTLVCTPYLTSPTPAFEAMIGISFVTVDAALNDAVMGATFRLITEMGDYRSSETDTFTTWISTYQLLARRAIDEGDLRGDTDPDAVGQLLVEIFAGARLLATATDTPATLPTRTAMAWDLLLPVLVTTPKVDYFRQFVTRRLSAGRDGCCQPSRRRARVYRNGCAGLRCASARHSDLADGNWSPHIVVSPGQ